jgi:hypothetical protein
MRVDELFYAGSSLDKALTIFSTMVRHWPRLQLTILASGPTLTLVSRV